MSKRALKRVIVAIAIVLATALVAYLAFIFWWIYGPWPWGAVISEQAGGWVVIRAEESGKTYRAWVAPEDRVSDSLLGEYMQVHPIGKKWTAEHIPW